MHQVADEEAAKCPIHVVLAVEHTSCSADWPSIRRHSTLAAASYAVTVDAEAHVDLVRQPLPQQQTMPRMKDDGSAGIAAQDAKDFDGLGCPRWRQVTRHDVQRLQQQQLRSCSACCCCCYCHQGQLERYRSTVARWDWRD